MRSSTEREKKMKEFGDFQHSNIPATITKARPIDKATLLLIYTSSVDS